MAEPVQRPLVAPQPASRAQSTNVPDPRSLVALSQALNTYLGEVNGPAGQADGAQFNQAAMAYGASGANVSTAGAAANAPATPVETLETIRDDFDRLYSGLELAATQVSDGAWSAETAQAAMVQVKAQAMQFAARLLTVTDDIKRLAASGGAQPAPSGAPTAPVQQTAAPASATPAASPAPKPEANAPADRPSFLSQISARFHKHFDEL